jgi:hypothetical protein
LNPYFLKIFLKHFNLGGGGSIMRKYSLLLVLVAIVAFLAVPAMAQEKPKTVDLYAQIWFDGWYEKADENVGRYTYALRNQSETLAYNDVKKLGYNSTDFSWGLNPIVTRFGANFKKDNLTGKVEIRPMESGGNSAQTGLPRWGSLIREWWAQYEFKSLGGMKVLIGQTYCPLYAPVYIMAQGGQNRWAGDMRPEDRTPQVMVTIPLGPDRSALKIAAIQPNQGKIKINSTGTVDQQVDGGTGFFDYYQNPYPKFEVAYNLNMKKGILGANVTAGVGYQQTKEVRQPTSEFAHNKVSLDVKSYVYGVTGAFTIGPAILRGSVHAAKNGKEYSDTDVLLGATTNATGTTVYDTSMYGYHFVVGAQLGKFTPYVSYGQNHAERDVVTTTYKMAGSWTSVGVLYKPNQTISIQPEFAIKDNGSLKVTGAADQKLGKQKYFGFTMCIYL